MSEIGKQEPDPRHRSGGDRGGDSVDPGGATPNAGSHPDRGDKKAGTPGDAHHEYYGDKGGDGSDGGGGTPNSGGPPTGE
jgi:hypothetical protein